MIPVPRNTGRITLMSNRWPVPIHGSFVTTTSPGDSVSAGNFRSMWASVAGPVPVNDGTLYVPCAIDVPPPLKSRHERS